MSALVEILYPTPLVRRSPLSLLRWWESRRLLYNKIVGGAGLVTLSVGVAIASLPGGGGLPNPMDGLAMVAIYGIFANGCYTLGWMLEMVARYVWGDRAPYMGPLLFREGLIFSVGLTLLPAFGFILFGMLRLLATIFG